MDREREIIHKILDGDADENDKRVLVQGMDVAPDLRKELLGITNAVTMLEQSVRLEAPASFTTEVMKKLPRTRPSAFHRIRNFLFDRRVLQWNMATALAAAVIVLSSAVVLTRLSQEPAQPAADFAGTTALIRLTFYSPRARTVAVAGDFNKWKLNADALQQNNGIWSIDLRLKPGVYAYSFIVDGNSWVPDPGAESYEEDGFGSRNAVLRVSI
jgi:hypothetical protein